VHHIALPIHETYAPESSFPIPHFLYLRLAASNICNLRCKHCHIWMNEDRRDSLGTARRIEILQEFARLRAHGMVEFPGGEVTLALDELCVLAAQADRLGLKAGMVTNGFTIRLPRTAQRLAESGLERISVSLDSPRAATHDYVRGVEGSFDRAVSAIELLIAARARAKYTRHGLKIQVMTTVFDGNIHDLVELVESCRALGVDEVNFQLLQRTFDNKNPDRDPFFERHFFHDAASRCAAKLALRDVVTRYAGDPLLRTRPRDLAWFDRSIERPDELPADTNCSSHWRNVIVDSDGAVSLCFNRPEGATEISVGNVARQGLAEVLASGVARRQRARMEICRKSCGSLECHRDSEGP
jgi:MoaA/NifB/PqqE/SkfB family radical SAM enzyme